MLADGDHLFGQFLRQWQFLCIGFLFALRFAFGCLVVFVVGFDGQLFLFRLVAGRVLEVGAEPADLAALLFVGAFGVERDQTFENLFVGQRDRPAVRLEHRRVQVVVNLFQDGDESLFVDRSLFVRQRLASPQLFEHVVHVRHRQLRMLTLLPLPVRVQLLRQFRQCFLALTNAKARPRNEAANWSNAISDDGSRNVPLAPEDCSDRKKQAES